MLRKKKKKKKEGDEREFLNHPESTGNITADNEEDDEDVRLGLGHPKGCQWVFAWFHTLFPFWEISHRPNSFLQSHFFVYFANFSIRRVSINII